MTEIDLIPHIMKLNIGFKSCDEKWVEELYPSKFEKFRDICR